MVINVVVGSAAALLLLMRAYDGAGSMSSFLEFTLIGISIGCVFAIAASGLVLTYTTTGVFNFAHGAVGMVSAFLFYQLRTEIGVAGAARPPDRARDRGPAHGPGARADHAQLPRSAAGHHPHGHDRPHHPAHRGRAVHAAERRRGPDAPVPVRGQQGVGLRRQHSLGRRAVPRGGRRRRRRAALPPEVHPDGRRHAGRGRQPRPGGAHRGAADHDRPDQLDPGLDARRAGGRPLRPHRRQARRRQPHLLRAGRVRRGRVRATARASPSPSPAPSCSG